MIFTGPIIRSGCPPRPLIANPYRQFPEAGALQASASHPIVLQVVEKNGHNNAAGTHRLERLTSAAGLAFSQPGAVKQNKLKKLKVRVRRATVPGEKKRP